ncbi:flagellar hook-basal body complex protein FliE [Escherichia sp. E10V10]|uniref:flagellar hook-basal body complex protein FliE n=1 Tax=unclassified Escherichia TaxID=2608889 RepID=UPI00102A172F|nr:MULTISPECIES: flagellar hook-basal body complex protein FliE [unclassified Escherichia]TGB62305.1 flagellar hook-basal body complex protein FliE [Escherichia coli]RZM85176.1 flagellar hook-basal body complex protein FliE [Escherichia sp. E1V33]RZM92094.1 flagellar hook-basal body complex protein FliE [Escherichia sp. E14V5]RZN00796.1 flagellar hook-basal body complex protein FliE [Escherichia sp. E14V7]RZN18246.1 flagellar hook-basal body complex protein FliE [Escherichia sp. E14S1]
MSLNTINGVVNQIQRQAGQVSAMQNQLALTESNDTENKTQFSDVLFNSLNNISQLQNQAKQGSEDYLAGVPGVGLNDVMVSMQKSSVALNLGVQVRNKMVSAYQDIMNMGV